MTKFQANRIASVTKCIPWKDSPQGTPQILAYQYRILRNEFIKLCIFREIVVVPVYADMEDLWLQESVTDINVRCSVWPREKSNSPRQNLLCCNRQSRRLTPHDSAAHDAGGGLLFCNHPDCEMAAAL